MRMSAKSRSASATRAWRLRLRRADACALAGAGSIDLDRLLALCCLRGGAVPVVHHLSRKDGVEDKASDEGVENERVWDLLEGGIDTRQGANEVVENLSRIS
jgi:hypothetical protein